MGHRGFGCTCLWVSRLVCKILDRVVRQNVPTALCRRSDEGCSGRTSAQHTHTTSL